MVYASVSTSVMGGRNAGRHLPPEPPQSPILPILGPELPDLDQFEGRFSRLPPRDCPPLPPSLGSDISKSKLQHFEIVLVEGQVTHFFEPILTRIQGLVACEWHDQKRGPASIPVGAKGAPESRRVQVADEDLMDLKKRICDRRMDLRIRPARRPGGMGQIMSGVMVWAFVADLPRCAR